MVTSAAEIRPRINMVSGGESSGYGILNVRENLWLFARIYGAEAGNLALKCLARGGVLIGGGIAPKILFALTDGEFMEGFCAKGRFASFMRTVPVRVALNPSTGLLGAADYAARCLL